MTPPVSSTRWNECTQYLTLGIAVYEDGTYAATLTSYYGDPRRWKRHTLGRRSADYTLAPAGLQALLEASGLALDAFWAGELD